MRPVSARSVRWRSDSGHVAQAVFDERSLVRTWREIQNVQQERFAAQEAGEKPLTGHCELQIRFAVRHPQQMNSRRDQ
jgi:hypothetical protein